MPGLSNLDDADVGALGPTPQADILSILAKSMASNKPQVQINFPRELLAPAISENRPGILGNLGDVLENILWFLGIPTPAAKGYLALNPDVAHVVNKLRQEEDIEDQRMWTYWMRKKGPLYAMLLLMSTPRGIKANQQQLQQLLLGQALMSQAAEAPKKAQLKSHKRTKQARSKVRKQIKQATTPLAKDALTGLLLGILLGSSGFAIRDLFQKKISSPTDLLYGAILGAAPGLGAGILYNQLLRKNP